MLIVGGPLNSNNIDMKKEWEKKTDSDVMSNQYEGNDKR